MYLRICADGAPTLCSLKLCKYGSHQRDFSQTCSVQLLDALPATLPVERSFMIMANALAVFCDLSDCQHMSKRARVRHLPFNQ